MYIYELRERLTVCRSVIAHLKARQETRWHSFAENLDYPERDDKNWKKYVNSRFVDGEIKIILRDITEEGQETLSSVSSERTSRVIDNEAAGSMERRKREGYF